MIMGSITNYFGKLKVALIIFCCLCMLSITVLADEVGAFKQGKESRKMLIGSRPPKCVNKCLNCNPCTATLVITSHQKKGLARPNSHGGDDDGNYYLLAWKCKCGNKLFQP